MARLLITIAVFSATLGGLFLTSTFHSADKVELAITDTTMPSSSPTKTAPRSSSKTASILTVLKNLALTESASPSPSPSISPTSSLPSLQRVSPTPIASSTQTPSPSPTSSPLPSSQSTSTPSSTPISSPTPLLTITPTPSPTGITVISSNPMTVARGNTAQVQIVTSPQIECLIKVVLPSGGTSRAAGLGNKISDPDGHITWTWTIGGSTTPGDGTIAINCPPLNSQYSATVAMTITN